MVDQVETRTGKLITETVTEEQTALSVCVKQSVERYIASLGGEQPKDLYNLVIAEMEIPLIEAVMKYTRGNESKAARVLGIARGTLRTMRKKYGFTKDTSKKEEV